MKVDVLKKLIKESVKEAIQEELKEVLLEALKSNSKDKLSNIQPMPYTTSTHSTISGTSMKTEINLREKYNQALNETTLNFTSQDVPKFSPTTVTDTVNGALPSGDVDLNQIMGLLK